MKKKTFLIIAAVIMLIGVMIALSVEMVSTTIYNERTGTTPTGIGLHVLVVMIFVTVSNVVLMSVTKKDGSLSKNILMFHGTYEITGLFFGLASGYQSRANLLYDYFGYTGSSPSWYSGDVTGSAWFGSIPMIADRFSSSATIFYILTVIGLIVTIYLASRVLGKDNA